MKRRIRMKCHLCGVVCEVECREGDGVWTAFCSPEHAHEWQKPRTEAQIIEETSGPRMPYDRCQWCNCTLKSGYHEDDCPVRALQAEDRSETKARP